MSAGFLTKSKKMLIRYARKDESANIDDVSAFLIAQFGKNFAVSGGNGISGTALMQYAIDDLKKAQHIVGGRVIFLECEDKPKLLTFYKSNDFIEYGERRSVTDGICYRQLMKLF